MIIAGIDPSLNNFGLAKGEFRDRYFTLSNLVLQETAGTKVKQVRKNSDDLKRAQLLYDATHEFIKDVDLVIVEVPVGSQSARSMASYGICIGLIASIKKPLIQVTPTEVKLAAVNNKNATKDQMIQWATTEFPQADWLYKTQKGVKSLVSKNEHLADAVAAIKAGIRSETFQQLQSFNEAIAI